MIRVGQLPEHPGPGIHLHCPECQGEYSAYRGDYFMADPKTIMRCCEVPLSLMQRRTVYQRVQVREKGARRA